MPQLPHVWFSNVCDQVEPWLVLDKWIVCEVSIYRSLCWWFSQIYTTFHGLGFFGLITSQPWCCSTSASVSCAIEFQRRLIDEPLVSYQKCCILFDLDNCYSPVHCSLNRLMLSKKSKLHTWSLMCFSGRQRLYWWTSLISLKWYMLYPLEEPTSWSTHLYSEQSYAITIMDRDTRLSTLRSLSFWISGRDSFKGGRL